MKIDALFFGLNKEKPVKGIVIGKDK